MNAFCSWRLVLSTGILLQYAACDFVARATAYDADFEASHRHQQPEFKIDIVIALLLNQQIFKGYNMRDHHGTQEDAAETVSDTIVTLSTAKVS
jgi:hypothetical protein